MQYSSCWLVLLFCTWIVLALICYRKIDNAHCFLDYIHESAFASLKASPPPRQSETREVVQLWNTVVDAARLIPMGSIKKRCNSEFAKWHDIYMIRQRSARTNECKITLILNDCVMNGFISFTVPFRGDVRGVSGLRKLASVSRRSGLHNGHVAD